MSWGGRNLANEGSRKICSASDDLHRYSDLTKSTPFREKETQPPFLLLILLSPSSNTVQGPLASRMRSRCRLPMNPPSHSGIPLRMKMLLDSCVGRSGSQIVFGLGRASLTMNRIGAPRCIASCRHPSGRARGVTQLPTLAPGLERLTLHPQTRRSLCK